MCVKDYNMNNVQVIEGVLQCSCGAKCEPKDKNRFRKRHPAKCSEKEEFTRQIAQGVRSVETDQQEDPVKYWMERDNAEGKNLTEWEIEFMKSMTTQIEERGSDSLSDLQKESLEKIYANRTS
jgi:hypothetical protein